MPTPAAATFAGRSSSPVTARKSRFQSRIEGAIVTAIMLHGMIVEIQKIFALKLSRASQMSVANVPKTNATRRSRWLVGMEYELSACTASENGNATTRSMK